MLNFTGIKDKNIRHVERKEILKLCPGNKIFRRKMLQAK